MAAKKKTNSKACLAEKTLASLCHVMAVDVDGLARQAALRDKKRQEELKDGESLTSLINVLFNADNSVADVTQLILKATAEPMWTVHVYWHDDDNAKHLQDSVILRSPTKTTAEETGVERVSYLHNYTMWSAEAFSVEGDDANCFEDADGIVRRL